MNRAHRVVERGEPAAVAPAAFDAARVDYIVVSADLVPRVTEAVIVEDGTLRPRSDHAPILLRLR